MIDPKKQTYVHYYNASAMALGGRITRPFDAIIETQAPAVLPIDGGLSAAHAEDFQFREIISFKRAHSVVTGSQSERDGSFATLASVTIEDLNILDVVVVRRIVSRISTHHPIPQIQSGAALTPSPEPQIVALGSKFEGLSVAGCALEVDLDANLSNEWSTYEALKKNSRLAESKGVIVCSLVKTIVKERDSACSGLTIVGNTITIPQFGKIHLAQFLCSSYARRLVMLRAELGCPVSGAAAAGCTQGNGTTAP